MSLDPLIFKDMKSPVLGLRLRSSKQTSFHLFNDFHLITFDINVFLFCLA
jgi:hypothetical protein